MPDQVTLSGELRQLQLTAGADHAVRAALTLRREDSDQHLPLTQALGRRLTLTFSGAVSCVHCGRVSKRSFGSGYCYPCFKSLARCDLCMVSPNRCHHHLGTCREPEWGESFCMQPHIVYLANTTGLKVGITREGRQQGRWMDQGAVMGLPILAALTRRDAGLAEVAIAAKMSDKTAWQQLVSGDPEPVDLVESRNRLKAENLELPAGVSWLAETQPVQFHYPVMQYPTLTKQLRAAADARLTGTLLGIKGQYLLLSTGVFNVRRFTGYHVEATLSDASDHPVRDDSVEGPQDGSDQLDLF